MAGMPAILDGNHASGEHDHVDVHNAIDATLTNLPRTQRVWSLENDFGGQAGGVFDNASAFTLAWSSMGRGDKLTLGGGIFATSLPVAPPYGHVVIEGNGNAWWPYNESGDAQDYPTAIRAITGFSAKALVYGRDKELNSGVEMNNCTLRNIIIDGNSAGTNTAAVLLEGEVKGWQFDSVTAMQATGHNFETRGYAASGAGRGTVWPRGGSFNRCIAWSAGKSTDKTQWGFYFDTYTDAMVSNCLSVSNQGGGFYIKNPAQLPFTNCISAFNINEAGYYITGSTTTNIIGGGNGGCSLMNCYSDRNGKDGVTVDLYGPRARVSIVGGDYRRDGNLSLAPGGTYPYAGVDNGVGGLNYGGFAAIALRGTSTNPVCPVILSAVTTAVEDDDTNDQNWQPQYGVAADYASELVIDGRIWGYSAGLVVTNSTNAVDPTRTTKFFKGSPQSTARDYPDLPRGEQFYVSMVTNRLWAVPSAQQRFLDNPALYTQVDLRKCNYAKITAQVITGGSASAALNVQYSIDSGTTWTNLALNNLTVNSSGYKTNAAFKVIPDAAKTDVLLRVVGLSGDGTTTAEFADIKFHGRL